MHRPPVKDRTQEFTAVVERVRKTASVTRETNGASASDASTTRGGARDDRAGDGNASDFAKADDARDVHASTAGEGSHAGIHRRGGTRAKDGERDAGNERRVRVGRVDDARGGEG